MIRTVGQLQTEVIGEGPEVYMLHGWGMHSGVWHDFAQVLAGAYRVTLVDLPGHGLSGLLPASELFDWTSALLDRAPARAHWLGWSLGAQLALACAGREPQRLASLTMIAGNARFAAAADWPTGMDVNLLARFGADLMTDYRATLGKFIGLQTFGLDNARALVRALQKRIDERPMPDGEALAAGLEMLRTVDLRGVLQTLSMPLLIMLGARDRLVPPAAGTAMEALAPNARCVVLPDAAHTPFLTEPERCATLLFEFWGQHEVR